MHANKGLGMKLVQKYEELAYPDIPFPQLHVFSTDGRYVLFVEDESYGSNFLHDCSACEKGDYNGKPRKEKNGRPLAANRCIIASQPGPLPMRIMF